MGSFKWEDNKQICFKLLKNSKSNYPILKITEMLLPGIAIPDRPLMQTIV